VLRRVLDAVVDAVVVSFAFWTLLYCLGLATQWSLYLSGWLWLVVSLGTLVVLVLRAVREPGRSISPPDEPGGSFLVRRRPSRQGLAMSLLGVGLVATVVAGVGGLVWTPGTFKPTWAATVVATGALLGWAWLTGRAQGVDPEDDPEDPLRDAEPRGVLADLGVLAVMAGCAVASLLIHLADTDDPYYVNRSVWVAEHGNAALRDTMFSPEVFNSPYGGGIPIASIESLYGVVAHMTGLHAGTVTYLVATPLGTALAVWATWRLCRRWAPRRAFLAFAGAIAFLMLSGDSMLGNFWIPRMWQGKVIAVTFLMPLIWAYLTEVVDGRLDGRRRRGRWLTLGLLLAAGIAFFGLTPTAVVWGPVMFGAVLAAAVLVRSRDLALGGLLMVAGPVTSGAAVVLLSTDVGGETPVALPSRASFVRILGEIGPMVALGLVALCLAALVARRGAPAAMAGASALVAVLVFAPGVLPLINTVTGSGPILWRMLYVAPIPVLAGLLACAPWPDRSRLGDPADHPLVLRFAPAAGVVAALVLVAGLAAGGRPVWAYTGHGGPVTVSSTPTWKLDLPALDDVRLLEKKGYFEDDAEVVLPPRRMKVMTMYTTEAFPVVPRDWFVQNIEEPRADKDARRLLSQLATGQGFVPTPERARKALERLDVDLVCTGESPNKDLVVRVLEDSGYADPRDVGTLTCLTRG